jgi:hypothetical protein
MLTDTFEPLLGSCEYVTHVNTQSQDIYPEIMASNLI